MGEQNEPDPRDAEIERLNSIIHAWSEAGCRYEHRISHQKQLITEFSDALRAKGSSAFLKSDIDLLKRAREATKE